MTAAEQFAQQLMANVQQLNERTAAIEMKLDVLIAALDKAMGNKTPAIMDGDEAADFFRGILGFGPREKPKRGGKKR